MHKPDRVGDLQYLTKLLLTGVHSGRMKLQRLFERLRKTAGPELKKGPLFVLPIIPVLCWFFLVFRFTRNLFVYYGAYFLDAGWNAYSLCTTNGLNPPAKIEMWRTESILGLHSFFSPLVACRAIGVFTSDGIVGFWILMGLQASLLSVLGLLVTKSLTDRRILSSGVALILPLTSIGIGTTGYPHVELFGSTLVAIGIILRLRGPRSCEVIGLVCLVLGLLGREDMGLHLVVTLLTSLLLLKTELDKETRNKMISMLTVAVLLMLVSYFVGRVVFASGASVASDQYGSFSDWIDLLRPAVLHDRIVTWIGANPGLIAFNLVLLLWSATKHDKRPLAVVLSSLPWVFVNFFSPNPAKTYLGIYHAFPWAIYLTCLAIPLCVSSANRRVDNKNREGASWYFATAVAMWALFTSFTNPPSGANYVVKSFWTGVNVSASQEMEIRAGIEQIRRRLSHDESLVIDSAIASWLPTFDDRILKTGQAIGMTVSFRNYVLERAPIESIAVENKLDVISCFAEGIIEVRRSVAAEPLEGVPLQPCP